MKIKLIIAISALALATSMAQAHRMTAHDYRLGHWCKWSAASVCATWRANGGKYGPTRMPNGTYYTPTPLRPR
jgi:hypothetical protein